jgi:putative PIN family toxin of toxin-antitoxin system
VIACISHRVVLDTNVIVAAGTRWLEDGRPSPDHNICRQILVCVAEKHIGLCCSKIIGEYIEKLIAKRHPSDRIVKFMVYLMGAFETITITITTLPHPPEDPDDEIFLICALDGAADYLVSDDRALLAVASHYSKPIIGSSGVLIGALGT